MSWIMMTHWPCTMPTVGKFFVKVYTKENNLNLQYTLVNKKLDDDVEEEVSHDDYESMESSTEQEEVTEINNSPNPNPRDHIKKEKVLRKKHFQVVDISVQNPF